MATVNFRYDYPYCGYGDNARYRHVWGNSQVTLNGNYSWPVVFNTTVPKCSHIQVYATATNISGNVLNISWDLYVYRASYGWVRAMQFVMPEAGETTIECDLAGFDITQVICVPSSRQGSGTRWTPTYTVKEMTITETLEATEPLPGTFQYGVFTNMSGVDKSLTEVYVNVGGTLKRATNVYANINGTLTPTPPVFSSYLKTERESMYLYKFVPPETGTYRIKDARISGDHELRLYDSSFTKLHSIFFYSDTFELTAGATYYITITHWVGESNTSESYLQIYKEA